MKKSLFACLAIAALATVAVTGSAVATDVGGQNGGPGHEHPIGASPLRVPLVPAFPRCVTANAQHDPASPGASCVQDNAPPPPASALLAVGPSSQGFVRIVVLGSGQCAPFDPSRCYPDATLRVNVTDVRSGTPTGSLYNGGLTFCGTFVNSRYEAPAQCTTLQQTDARNGGFGSPCPDYTCSGTVLPQGFRSGVGCTAGTCNLQTTFNALQPGMLVAGARDVIELGQLQLLDSSNGLFENQGVFAP